MNTFQLECFLRVASTLNFARAAEELNVTQPAVTHQIQTLENELKVKLLYRSTRNVSLTQEGEMLLPEVKDLIIRLTAIGNKFSEGNAKPFVPFRIGCMGDTLFGLLPDVLFRLSSAEPNVHPILRFVAAPQVAKCIEEGYVDVAVGIREKLPKGSVRYTEIARTPLVCVCDETHPLSEKKRVRLADVEESSLIFFRPAVCAAETTALQLQLSKGRSPDKIFFCDELSAAFTLARAGFGALLLPLIFVPDFFPMLTKIPVEDYPAMSFGMYGKEDADKLQQEFLRLVRQRLEKQPEISAV